MKKIMFLLMMLVTFGSCDMNELEASQEGLTGFYKNLRIQIAIVDSGLNDRLNTESQSYLGETYTKDIEVLYAYKGQKLSLFELWPDLTNEEVSFPENYKTVEKPYRETADYGDLSYNTHGYYFIPASPVLAEPEQEIAYVYIRYPDGSEDEIKVELFRNKKGTLLIMGKIWINDELVYAMSEDWALSLWDMLPDSADRSDPDFYSNYYNLKYYPWLEPVLDDDGNQMGNRVQPKCGSDLIVIMK